MKPGLKHRNRQGIPDDFVTPLTVSAMVSGGLRAYYFSNRENARAGYKPTN